MHTVIYYNEYNGIRKGRLEMKRTNKSIYSILGILSSGPKSGYGIKKYIEGSISYFWAESFGQIYPTLKLLIEERLISTAEDKNNNKLECKIYTITEMGSQKLQIWLNQPVEDITFDRNELLLKLFFSADTSVQSNINNINLYRNRRVRELDIYNAIEKDMKRHPEDNDIFFHQMLTLRHGQAICGAIVKWCDESINILNKRSMNNP